MNTAIATLPGPQDIALEQVRTSLIPRAQLIRKELREAGDLAGASELLRRLEAFRRYITNREARDDIAAESRRTEVVIGELLGPGERGEHGRGRPLGSHAGESIAKDDRHRFRLLASHATLVEELLSQGFITRRVLLQKIEQADRPAPNDHSADLTQGPPFTTIVADPPWRYANKATRAAAGSHYLTLDVPEICAFAPPEAQVPVRALVGEAGHLYLWTTNSFLRQAFDVVEAWGFEYKTCLTWVKPQIGIGNYFRNSSEHVLFAVRGGLRTNSASIGTWFQASRGQHSRKPESFYDLIEASSSGPYLELFGRPSPLLGVRLGWTVWGNEA